MCTARARGVPRAQGLLPDGFFICAQVSLSRMTWYRLYFLLGQLLVKSRGQCVVEVECRVSAGQGGGFVVVGEWVADDVSSDKEWMVGRRVGVRWLRQRISGLLSRVRRDGVDGHYCVPALES